MNITELSRKAYQSAKSRGLYDKEQPLEHYLMLVIDEISECHKASLEGREADIKHFNHYTQRLDALNEIHTGWWVFHFERCIKNSTPDELADICIMCFSVLGWKTENISTFEAEIVERNFTSAVRIASGSFQAIPDLLTSLSFRAAIGEIEYVLAYTMQYCKANNIDLDWHVEQKMKYNELRER